MEPVSITVANELAALPVLQASVNAFAQAEGAPLSVARQMELVVEEIITNIIKFEYLPGQKELIELELRCMKRQLELTMRFKGIPFDIEYLQRCEQVSQADLLTGEVRGIGLHLVRQCIDDLQYRNLGKEGQQIRIFRGLASLDAVAPTPVAEASVEPSASPVQVVIRRMLPEESATVSKLAYFAYDYTYIYDYIYDPEQVRDMNRAGRLISYVATCLDTQEIVGHCALIPDQLSGLDELGVAFVNPSYRGGGCLNDLSEELINEAQARGAAGVYAIAVTTHPFSQKAAARHGLRETALLVSRVQPVDLRAIQEHSVARESVLFMARLFDEPGRGVYHAPLHHRSMVREICLNLGVSAEFADATGAAIPMEQGVLEQSIDHFQAGHIHLVRYGNNTLAEVRALLRRWCLDRLETIYLYLPLKQPATAELTASFEMMGFFFSGLQPVQTGNDLLVLQYLNNQRYGYSVLKAATPFGQQLIDYVRDCDPDGSAVAKSPLPGEKGQQ